MIEEIDLKIERLLKCRDRKNVINNPNLRALICVVIEKAYFLEYIVLSNKTFKENIDNQFFVAREAINRQFRDSGLDEVADIFNELHSIAQPYLI